MKLDIRYTETNKSGPGVRYNHPPPSHRATVPTTPVRFRPPLPASDEVDVVLARAHADAGNPATRSPSGVLGTNGV